MSSVAKFTHHSVRLLGWSDEPFLILMERFDCSLDSFLLLQRQSPLDISCVVEIISNVCDALSVCERMSIVHNDIKPSKLKN